MMKKTIRFFCICFVITVCFLLSACSSLEGNWHCDYESYVYPDAILLESGGKGSFDGIDCTWFSKDGVLSITEAWEGTHKYQYELDGDKLILKEVDRDDCATYSKN